MCHLHASLDVPQPTASRHLAYLRKSGLVDARATASGCTIAWRPIDNPVVASVVTAALHALTHTAISVKDERRLQVALQSVVTTVLFACVHNAGRSQIAAALFNALRRSARRPGDLRGTNPADRVHPEVVDVMQARGIDLVSQRPQRLTPMPSPRQAQWLITMGCGDECPVVPGTHRDDWPIPDPKGQSTRP